jgi:hypothetical protein
MINHYPISHAQAKAVRRHLEEVKPNSLVSIVGTGDSRYVREIPKLDDGKPSHVTLMHGRATPARRVGRGRVT